MTRRGRRSTQLPALLAALALAAGGLPGSPLLEHEHAAGDRAHRHVHEASALADLLVAVSGHVAGHGHAHPHGHGAAHGHRHHPGAHVHGAADVHPSAHRERESDHVGVSARGHGLPAERAEARAPARPGEEAIGPASAAPTRHSHWVSILHVAARSAPTVVAVALRARPTAAASERAPERAFAGRLRARSPPSLAV